MVAPIGNHRPPLTKDEAASQLVDLMARHGMYVTAGSLVELIEKHWSKVAMLTHAIHDDWREVETAYDAAVKGVAKQRQLP